MSFSPPHATPGSAFTAAAVGCVLCPFLALLYSLGLTLAAAFTRVSPAEPGDAFGGVFLFTVFSLPVTLPVGALTGLVLDRIVRWCSPRGSALIALPLGFLAGVACTYGLPFLLSARSTHALFLGWPLWLYAAICSALLTPVFRFVQGR